MKKTFPLLAIVIPLTVLLLSSISCTAAASIIATPTTVPSLVPPTPTSAPSISQQVTLVAKPANETNQNPPFTITSETPELTGSDDPRVAAFNQRLNDLVSKEVDTWRQSFLQNTAPVVNNGSSLNVKYTLVSQMRDIWSFKFDFDFYSDGAAHPGLNSITLNYDLAQGKDLALADLFLPNSDYLGAISQYCVHELSKQPFFDTAFAEGAKPTPENYRNWNITPDGLMITFDEYQVAPYAAGPQTINVPYSELKSLINPQGPLARLLQ